MKKRVEVVIYSSIILYATLLHARSIHRPVDPLTPTIITAWPHDTNIYFLQNYHIKARPYFHLFNKDFFKAHQLPTDFIPFRNQPNGIDGSVLSEHIEIFLQEIKQKRNYYTHFIVLKKRDFTKRDQTGLIVVKHRTLPFVVKLFIETPESFVNPLSKGFEPTCLFMMGGGVNRHLSGFTRIKNLENVQQKIAASPAWNFRVDFPRKWFWLPKEPRWITLEGKNLDEPIIHTVEIPAIYAIVCDYIDIERRLELSNQHDRRIAMNLSNFLNQCVDPHINNYVIEKTTRKILVIDTEHFPTMVGYDDPPRSSGYLQWYSHLSCKMLNDTMGQAKYMRRNS